MRLLTPPSGASSVWRLLGVAFHSALAGATSTRNLQAETRVQAADFCAFLNTYGLNAYRLTLLTAYPPQTFSAETRRWASE